MMKPIRKGYPTKELAVSGAIEQMAQVKVVGCAQSAVDTNLRHQVASEAMVSNAVKDREMMTRLRNNIKRKPLTADQMSELYYPKRRIK